MRLIPMLDTTDLASLQFSVIVDCWDRKSYGRGKRLYQAEFTKVERAKIGRLHTLFYGWSVGMIPPGRVGAGDWMDAEGGTPPQYQFTLVEIALIHRAVAFFATL